MICTKLHKPKIWTFEVYRFLKYFFKNLGFLKQVSSPGFTCNDTAIETGCSAGPWWSDLMARAGYAMTMMTAMTTTKLQTSDLV